MNDQGQDKQEMQEREGAISALGMGEIRLPPKLAQVVASRKVWAGLIGLVATLSLWWLGEIDGGRALEAMSWVLGIFIGSVALEDGMARLFTSLAQAVATPAAQRDAGVEDTGKREGSGGAA